MDFRNEYPDYAEIGALVRRARLERSVAVAELIAGAVYATGGGLRRIARAIAAGFANERWHRAMEARIYTPQ